MFLMVGGNQSTQRKPMQTQGEHANSTQKFLPRTLLMLEEQTRNQTQDLLAVTQQC